MRTTVNRTVLELVQGDLTREAVDAVVNAANSSLLGGGGVDGAIHRAGGPAILEECRAIVAKIGRLPAGQAVITIGGRLQVKHVIHTVGPFWSGGSRGEDETLAGAYRESLRVAVEHACRSVAFPSISTGAYRFPVNRAARVALGAVKTFLDPGVPLDLVRFVLFDTATLDAYKMALKTLKGQVTSGK